MTHSVLIDPVLPRSHKTEVYVDDPCLAIRGTSEVRRTQVARAVLAWAALGVRLAFKKGQYGAKVDWIGAQLTIVPRAVEAVILEHRLKELKDMITAIRGKNIISVKL